MCTDTHRKNRSPCKMKEEKWVRDMSRTFVSSLSTRGLNSSDLNSDSLCLTAWDGLASLNSLTFPSRPSNMASSLSAFALGWVQGSRGVLFWGTVAFQTTLYPLWWQWLLHHESFSCSEGMHIFFSSVDLYVLCPPSWYDGVCVPNDCSFATAVYENDL